jgi:hypothetical protein
VISFRSVTRPSLGSVVERDGDEEVEQVGESSWVAAGDDGERQITE